MPISFSLRQLALYCVAILFAAAATLYSVVWVLRVPHWVPGPGIANYEYFKTGRFITIDEVFPESPAEQAGLRPGDRIIRVNGQALDSLVPFYSTKRS